MSDSTPPVPRFPSQLDGAITPAPRSAEIRLEPGTVLVGKYRLDRLLGAGGMGFVALATHLQLDQRVALKFLRPEAAARPDLVKRFALEARAAAKIRGDHVSRVSDVSSLEDGTPFMVMEYLEGEDLSERLTRLGRLDFAEAAGYVLEACDAIGEAHSLRLIHRDLKPSNLFLARRPDGSEIVKVLDFGISKMLEDATPMTQTQASFGSIPYMAPEQMRNARHCDERTDIWALGVTFYELISQNYPFPGSTGPEVIAAVMEGALVPIEQLRPDATPLVRRVISLCTQRDPSQRYIDISELANDLATIVGTSAARERAVRIARVVAPGADQLNVGSLEVDMFRRASLGSGKADAAGSAPAPARIVVAGTAPLGPPHPYAGTPAPAPMASFAGGRDLSPAPLAPPGAVPGPPTGTAGPVVLSNAVSPASVPRDRAKMPSVGLMAIVATLTAATLLGGAVYMRTRPGSGAEKPVSTTPVVGAPELATSSGVHELPTPTPSHASAESTSPAPSPLASPAAPSASAKAGKAAAGDRKSVV